MIFQRKMRNKISLGLHRMRGFSLVSAIFLLVVLAALGAAIVTVSTVQHQSSALDIQGVRAYQAARAGIEWGLYQQRIVGNCAGSTNIALPAGTSLTGFTVTVACVADTGLGLNIPNAVIQATACNQPAAGGACPNQAANSSAYVQRVLQVQVQ